MSGGRSHWGNCHQKSTSCTSCIEFGKIYDSADPSFVPACIPPFPAESQGADSWEISFKPWPAGGTMTAAFRTSKCKACEAVIRSLGFGWGLHVAGHAHTCSWGSGPNLRCDLEILVVFLCFFSQHHHHVAPEHEWAPYYLPSWEFTVIDQNQAPSTSLLALFFLYRNPFTWLHHCNTIKLGRD